MFVRLAVIVVFLFQPFSAARAEPSVSKDVTYYEIKGRDVPFLTSEMDNKGPDDINSGRSVWALTRWNVRWNPYYEETRLTCAFKHISTAVSLRFTVPKWIDNEGVNPRIQESWNNFYAALQKHEYQHAMHGIDAAREIEKTLMAMDTEPSCRILKEKADAIVDKIIDKHAARDVAYDEETDHGLTEGVTLQ